MEKSKSKFKRFLVILILASSIYFAYNIFRGEDPAEYVSDLSVPDTERLHEFKTNNTKTISLYVKGLRHILERHSADYYTDYKEKGTLFHENTTGKQIIKGVQKLILSGDTIRSQRTNLKIEKVIKLNSVQSKYRLIISPDNKIVTFFRVKDIK